MIQIRNVDKFLKVIAFMIKELVENKCKIRHYKFICACDIHCIILLGFPNLKNLILSLRKCPCCHDKTVLVRNFYSFLGSLTVRLNLNVVVECQISKGVHINSYLTRCYAMSFCIVTSITINTPLFKNSLGSS